ncbi:hypothetical protein HY448_01535 [Candidatus Pacearchaeota archaeon]|nr:hypothetical protein [Candidatus Pacearchaeota archaeon]
MGRNGLGLRTGIIELPKTATEYCEHYLSGEAKPEEILIGFLGYNPVVCPYARNCPYGNGKIINFEGDEIEVCKTHGKKSGLTKNIHSLVHSLESLTKPKGQSSS